MDPLGAHLLRREHAEQSDGAVTDNDHRRAWLHVGGVGREPPRAHHVGKGQEARDHVGIWDVVSRDECAVREGHAHVRRLRANNRFEALAGRLIPVSAVRARVVRREERPDHELARSD
jgi:hypothetical protein